MTGASLEIRGPPEPSIRVPCRITRSCLLEYCISYSSCAVEALRTHDHTIVHCPYAASLRHNRCLSLAQLSSHCLPPKARLFGFTLNHPRARRGKEQGHDEELLC